MGLDIKTLFVADVALLLVTAVLSLYFWQRDRDGDWLLWWAGGTAMLGVAMLAVGISGPVPNPVVGLPAAAVFFAGFMLVWQSMRRLNGRPPANRTVIVAVLAFAIALAAAVVLGASLRERSGLLLAAAALSAMACAFEVAFGAETLWRSRLPLAAVFFVMAVLLGMTAVLMGLRQHGPVASFADLLGDTLPLVNSLGTLGVCFYVMLIVNEQARSRYRRLASTDELTGLPNRRFFIDEATRRANRTASPACVLMMDLDHFSEINRRFGHDGGDRALRAFADVLRQRMRTTDVAARYGGEEFCALLADTDVAEAVRIAERLREAVAGLSIDVDGQAARVTVSIGIAPFRKGNLAASVTDADNALYWAKDRGRNQVAVAPADGTKAASATRPQLRIVR